MEGIKRIILAIKMRVRPPKRRTPQQRLKSRLYYRKNRSKIRLQRRKYLRKHKTTLKRRKLFMRYKPPWIRKPKHPHKPSTPKPTKAKVRIPKRRSPKRP